MSFIRRQAGAGPPGAPPGPPGGQAFGGGQFGHGPFGGGGPPGSGPPGSGPGGGGFRGGGFGPPPFGPGHGGGGGGGGGGKGGGGDGNGGRWHGGGKGRGKGGKGDGNNGGGGGNGDGDGDGDGDGGDGDGADSTSSSSTTAPTSTESSSGAPLPAGATSSSSTAPAATPIQINSPCPTANGTEIGTIQQFTLSCGADLTGNTIAQLPMIPDMTTCVDLCSSFHPRCDGATYDGQTCTLKSGTGSQSTPATNLDSAIAQFPTAMSNCASTGGMQQTDSDIRFNTFCNFIINGKDITQNFAPSFQECMGQCAATTGCGGVSFDPSLAEGFKNCYLKVSVTQGDALPNVGVDSAIVQAGTSPDPASDSSSPVASDSSSPSIPPGAAAAGTEGDTSSRAWIAAPVVGSVAALVVIAVMFIMLGKRRKGNGSGSTGSGRSMMSYASHGSRHRRKPTKSSNIFSTWLPKSPSKRKMGNFATVSGNRPPPPARTAGLRAWRPSGLERLEDIEEAPDGKDRVPDNMNPLGQHKL